MSGEPTAVGALPRVAGETPRQVQPESNGSSPGFNFRSYFPGWKVLVEAFRLTKFHEAIRSFKRQTRHGQGLKAEQAACGQRRNPFEACDDIAERKELVQVMVEFVNDGLRSIGSSLRPTRPPKVIQHIPRDAETRPPQGLCPSRPQEPPSSSALPHPIGQKRPSGIWLNWHTAGVNILLCADALWVIASVGGILFLVLLNSRIAAEDADWWRISRVWDRPYRVRTATLATATVLLTSSSCAKQAGFRVDHWFP